MPNLSSLVNEYWIMGEAGNAVRVGQKGLFDLSPDSTNVSSSVDACNGLAAYFPSGLTGMGLSVPATGALQPGDTDFEFTGWFNADTGSVQLAYLIACQAGTFSNPFDYLIDIRDNADNTKVDLIWKVRDAASTAYGQVTQTGLLKGTWYFYDVYHSASGNEIGISVTALCAVARAAFTTLSWSGGVASTGGTFWMGESPFVGNTNYAGYINQCGCWSAILSGSNRDYLSGIESVNCCPPAYSSFSSDCDHVACAGGVITFTVTPSGTGPISYAASDTWFSVSGPSSGAGTVTVTVSSNAGGSSRTGTLTVNDASFTLTQLGGC